MPATTVFNKEFIEAYAFTNKRHKDYEKWVKQMNRIKVHADGIMPKKLIEERRPYEMDETKKYREMIFEPVTKDVPNKMVTSIGKIRRSQDWSVTYDKSKIPDTIAKEETLQAYCEVKFDEEFETLEEWFFSVCLRQYLIDPTGVIAVMPRSWIIEEVKYVRPFPTVYNSDKVLDFVSDQYAVLKSTDRSEYYDGATRYGGDVYYVITTTEIQRWEQKSNDRALTEVVNYKHGLGFLPVFKMGGVIVENNDNSFIYESRIDGIVPRLNEAAREYSDLQAEVVQHIHSEKWTYLSQDCTQCQGQGKVKKGAATIDCNGCLGTGKVAKSPYGTFVIRPGMAGENPPPVPPAGYIPKDIAIVKIQDERIDKHLYMAMASCNMQFLWQTPLNQSGLAKEVDRDELNTLIYSIAEDCVARLSKLDYTFNEYRYRVIVPDAKARQEMLPVRNVPEKYDLLSSSFYIDELKKAKDANVNPVIIQSMEIEYAGKKFNANPDIKHTVQLIFSLDPLGGLNDDQKQSRLTNKGISQEDYVISCNIQSFIKRAMLEDKNFATLDALKQYEKLFKYAQEKIKLMSAAEKVMSDLNPPAEPPVPAAA